MKLTLPQLKAGLALRSVSRASLSYLHKPQKVDQHALRTTVLYAYLGGNELLATLLHDAEETATGDIPSPAKQHISGLDNFDYLKPKFKSKKEQKLAKLCDRLETVIDLLEHKESFGNKLNSKMSIILMVEQIRVLHLAQKLNKLREVNKLLVELGYDSLGDRKKVIGG